VIDHPPPVRGPGRVSRIHHNQAVVPGEDLVGDVDLFGGHFVIAFLVLVRAEDIELVSGLVVDELRDFRGIRGR
jgi:ribonuclease HIII